MSINSKNAQENLEAVPVLFCQSLALALCCPWEQLWLHPVHSLAPVALPGTAWAGAGAGSQTGTGISPATLQAVPPPWVPPGVPCSDTEEGLIINIHEENSPSSSHT